MARKSTSNPSKAADAAPPPGDLSYEEAVEELEGIIRRIEQGQVGLEESLAAYRRGALLLKRCRDILESAEQQVQQLTASETGKLTTETQRHGEEGN